MIDNGAALAERRQHKRIPCTPPQEISVAILNSHFAAQLEDISAFGARLRLPRAGKNAPMEVLGIFDYAFSSARGSSRCLARTAWIQRVDADLVWGIEFINAAEGSSELMRLLGATPASANA